jgi:hypothetical protein
MAVHIDIAQASSPLPVISLPIRVHPWLKMLYFICVLISASGLPKLET